MDRGLSLGFVAALGCTFDPTTAGTSSNVADTTTGADTSSGTAVVTSNGPTSTTIGDPTTDATATTMRDETTAPSGPESSTGRGTESSGDASTTTGAFDCTDVLYVAGSAEIDAYDQPFYDVLVKLGAEITVVPGPRASATDAEGRCLVVVSASANGSDVAGKFRDVTVPFVTWEYAIYDDMLMTGAAQDTDFGAADPEEDIDIVDDAHPMAAGLSGTVTVAEPAPGRLS